MINRKQKISYILAWGLLISGCELIGPELHQKLPLEPVKQTDQEDETKVIYEELNNDTADQINEGSGKIELYPGTGRFVLPRRNSRPKISTGTADINFNFNDMELSEVVEVIFGILNENYVISPKVSGKVTLKTAKSLTRDELMPTLDTLLQMNNAALVYQDGLYQIKPKAEAIVSSAFTTYSNYKQKIPAGYQIRVVPIKNVAVEELVEIIKPLMQEKTVLHMDSSRNLLIIAGAATELNRAMEMVDAFDIDVMKGKSFGLFPLKNVEATKMITELEQVFSKKDSTGSGGFFQFMEIERLNAILAITHQVKYLKQIEHWILRLDKANTTSSGGVIVYRAQHVEAVKLAETLNEIFSKSGQRNSSSSVAPGRRVVQVTNKDKAKSTSSARGNARRNNRSVSDIGEVKIIADEINNALIIVATAQDYAVVQRVIKKLDVMPLQVLIDATIVEVTLTDELEYGIKWFLSHNNGGQNAIASDSSIFTDAAAVAAGAATGGFGYAFLSNSGDISAVLNAAATDNTLNVISSPSLMVLNNQEATIQVGDEVPIRTSESTNTNASTNPIQTSSIQQRKTGVKLKVKPRVNASGLVIMEIEQSVENVSDSAVTGSNIDSPTISTREISSTVAVKSGETIILGGLIQENDQYNKQGIPVLHKLPLIGALFGNTEKTNNRTELVVLITPRVVNSRQDARLITNEFKRKLSGIYEDPIEEVEH